MAARRGRDTPGVGIASRSLTIGREPIRETSSAEARRLDAHAARGDRRRRVRDLPRARSRMSRSGRLSAMLPPDHDHLGIQHVDQAGAHGADRRPRRAPGVGAGARRPRPRRAPPARRRPPRRRRPARARRGGRRARAARGPRARGRCRTPIASACPARPQPQSGPSRSTVMWPTSPAVPSGPISGRSSTMMPPPMPGRDGHVDRRSRAPTRGSVAPLGHDRDVRVPLEEGRQVERIGDALAQRHVAPARQVGGRDHDAAPGVERAG